MFKLLKKKTYVLVGCFLLISMAFTFIVVYSTYSSLLTKDFLNKQKFLATQTTRTFKEHLMFLDEQALLFINKNQLHNKLQTKNYSSMDNLYFDNIDFVQLDIYSTDKLVASLKNISSSFNAESLSISNIKDYTGDRDGVWHIYNTPNNPELALICIKPIKSSNKISGYLVAWINPDTINNILLISPSYKTDEKAMFSEYTTAAIFLHDDIYICGDKSDAQLLKTMVNKEPKTYVKRIRNNSYLFYFDIELQNMSLILKGDVTLFKSYLSRMRKILLTVYVIISILIVSSLYFFNYEVSTAISKLYNKMMFDNARRV